MDILVNKIGHSLRENKSPFSIVEMMMSLGHRELVDSPLVGVEFNWKRNEYLVGFRTLHTAQIVLVVARILRGGGEREGWGKNRGRKREDGEGVEKRERRERG